MLLYCFDIVCEFKYVFKINLIIYVTGAKNRESVLTVTAGHQCPNTDIPDFVILSVVSKV